LLFHALFSKTFIRFKVSLYNLWIDSLLVFGDSFSHVFCFDSNVHLEILKRFIMWPLRFVSLLLNDTTVLWFASIFIWKSSFDSNPFMSNFESFILLSKINLNWFKVLNLWVKIHSIHIFFLHYLNRFKLKLIWFDSRLGFLCYFEANLHTHTQTHTHPIPLFFSFIKLIYKHTKSPTSFSTTFFRFKHFF